MTTKLFNELRLSWWSSHLRTRGLVVRFPVCTDHMAKCPCKTLSPLESTIIYVQLSNTRRPIKWFNPPAALQGFGGAAVLLNPKHQPALL